MADPLGVESRLESDGNGPVDAGVEAAPIPPRATVSVAERRRSLITCLWLAVATLLGGLDLPAHGYAAFQFAPFGIVAGLLAILYVFVLVQRGVIDRGVAWTSPLLLVYWTAGTATMFRVLLPPPGLVQVALVFFAALAAAVIVSRGDREEAALWLGIVAVILAVLRFALVPAFEARSSLPDWGPLKLGGAADTLRDFFVAYVPQRPATEALHLAALVAYALALKAQWSAAAASDPASGSG